MAKLREADAKRRSPAGGAKRKHPELGKKPLYSTPDAQNASKKFKFAGSSKPPSGGKPGSAFAKGGKPAAAHGAAGAAPSVKLTKKEQKEAKREKLSKIKRNFNLIEELAHDWEQIRRHDISAEQRSTVVTEVLRKVKGRVAELSGSHVASRVMQTCAKHGSASQRAAMLEELQPNLLDLARSPYGHFVVRKLVSTAPKEAIPGLLKRLRGQLGPLLRHPCGATVVDDLYDVASTAQRDEMAAEFYGKEFVLFDLPSSSAAGGGTGSGATGSDRLAAIMAAAEPAKRRKVIHNMAVHLHPIMEKALVDPALTHRLLAEFLTHAPASVAADAVESLAGDKLLRISHTREGAAAACMVLAYGTAKDRKKALKAIKEHVYTMAIDEHAHLVLVTALRVVDDTSLLRKSIISGLQERLEELACDRYGHRVLLALLAPDAARHWPPSALALARPPPKRVLRNPAMAAAAAAAKGDEVMQEEGGEPVDGGEDDDGAMDDEFPADAADGEDDVAFASGSDDDDELGGGVGGKAAGGGGLPVALQGEVLGVSKKDPLVRRRELLGGGGAQACLAGQLLRSCAKHAGEWMRGGPSSAIVVETAAGGQDGLVTEAAGQEPMDELHRVLAELAAEQETGQQQQQKLQKKKEAADAAAGPSSKQQQQREQQHLLTDYFASRALRRLLLASTAEGAEGDTARRAAEALWDGALKGRCGCWLGGHADKVLAALVQCGSPEVAKHAAKELAPLLKKWAGDQADVQAWAQQFCSKQPLAAAAGQGTPAQGGKKAGGKAAAEGKAKVAAAGKAKVAAAGKAKVASKATPAKRTGKK